MLPLPQHHNTKKCITPHTIHCVDTICDATEGFPAFPSFLSAKRRFRAFTLIELLVVIMIIALLAALLSPTLRRALQSSKGLECMNNQRSLGIVTAQYISDYHRYIPLPLKPPTNGDLTEGLYSGDTAKAFDNRGWSARLGMYLVSSYTNPMKWPHDFKPLEQWKMFWCPNDSKTQIFDMSGQSRPRLSYAQPLALARSTTSYGLRITNPQLREASAIIALVDNDDGAGVWTNWRDAIVGSTSGGGVLGYTIGHNVGYRHLGLTNLLFLDGHVGKGEPALMSSINFQSLKLMHYK